MAHHNVDFFNGALAMLSMISYMYESNRCQTRAAVNRISAQARADMPPVNMRAANLRDRPLVSLAQHLRKMEQQKRALKNFQATVAYNLSEVSGPSIDANFSGQLSSAGPATDEDDKDKNSKKRKRS